MHIIESFHLLCRVTTTRPLVSLSYKRRKWKGSVNLLPGLTSSVTKNVKRPPKKPRYFWYLVKYLFSRGKTRVSIRCSKGCLDRNCFTTFHANLVKFFLPPSLSLRVRATIGNQGNRMGRAVTVMLPLLTFISPLSGSGGDVCLIPLPLLSWYKILELCLVKSSPCSSSALFLLMFFFF